MRAPDGTYEDGFVVPGTASSPVKSNKSASNLQKNNPLSLHDDVSVPISNKDWTHLDVTESMAGVVCSHRTPEDHIARR